MCSKKKAAYMQKIQGRKGPLVDESVCREEEYRQRCRDLQNMLEERTQQLQEIKELLAEEMYERQTAHQELANMVTSLIVSENLFSNLFAMANNAAAYFKVVTDEGGQPVDLEYVRINPAYEKLTGFKQQEVAGKCVTELYSQMDLESYKWMSSYFQVALTGTPATFINHFPYVRRWYTLSAFSPERGYVAVVVGNVAEVNRTEELIMENRERYEAILKQSSEGILVIDVATMQIVETNDTYLRMFDYQRTEVEGVSFLSLREADKKSIQQLLAGLLHQSASFGIQRERTANRKSTWVEGIGSLIHHRGKQLALLTYRDVTEQKQAEEERLENQRRTAMMERMASLGTLAAGIAHEINQPLNALKLTADGAIVWYKRGKLLETADILQKFQRISANAQRIDNIVIRMREFVNGSRISYHEKVAVNQVVQQSLELLSERLRVHDIRLETTLFEERPPLVLGSASRIEEIVINIVINALQALDTVDQPDKKIWIRTDRQEEQVVMEFGNNGPCIPDNVLGKIFEPFFSTKASNVNMGLGLAIVKSAVEIHQGRIEVENLSPGVVFRIIFPCYEACVSKPQSIEVC